jgi:hypothetical protein
MAKENLGEESAADFEKSLGLLDGDARNWLHLPTEESLFTFIVEDLIISFVCRNEFYGDNVMTKGIVPGAYCIHSRDDY